jgi:phosphoribosylformylglycinamidine synthase
VYVRETREPAYFEEVRKFDIDEIKQPGDLKAVAGFLCAEPNIASKRWIYEQYDSMVQTNNSTTNFPSDAAIIRIKGTDKALALKVDCNPYYVFADPFKGTAIAVSEAARNIICSGGTPVAITNNLNFGNPYNPEVYYQFTQAVMGMREACLKFDTPVTGGNVSFYNQSADGGAVMPTPTIGMLGMLEDINKRCGLAFQNPGDSIFLIGASQNDIASSQYLIKYHDVKYSPAPYFQLDEEFKVQAIVKSLIENNLVASAHDVSDGGLFICLLESAMPNNFGFDIKTDPAIRKDAFLFGESQSRIVVSVSNPNVENFRKEMTAKNADYSFLGKVSDSELTVDGEYFGSSLVYETIYEGALPGKLN